MSANPKTGNWVITDGERFFNPHNGKLEGFFNPSKHLYYSWGRVKWTINFYSGKICNTHVHVEKVNLNPTFTIVDPAKLN